ncbi:hypothetical protein, partial [Burkholderia guangdongensis]|uniref:hypothetical protein n=1 Tax=Burkholderia guangdongensis TaxID=1792500 RepID=UPI001C53A5C5
QLLDQLRVKVQALARFNRHFFLAFAWHKVAPWPSVYASHTRFRIGSSLGIIVLAGCFAMFLLNSKAAIGGEDLVSPVD